MEKGTPSRVSGLLTKAEKATIAIIPNVKNSPDSYKTVIAQASRKPNKESGLSEHHFRCLPLTMGNGYGFYIYSQYDLEFTWVSDEYGKDVDLKILSEQVDNQSVAAHFGTGTITFMNRFTLRGADGTNVIITDPPNRFNHGWKHLTAVVEIDNLRRDFANTIKATKIGETVRINKGDVIGWVIPIPRHYADSHDLVDGDDFLPEDVMQEERDIQREFTIRRQEDIKNNEAGVGQLYMKGYDAYDNKFDDHQTRPARGKCPFSKFWKK